VTIDEKTTFKNMPQGLFKRLSIVQHMAIRMPEEDEKLFDPDQINFYQNRQAENNIDDGEDNEEVSEPSIDEQNIADGQQNDAKNKKKILFASMSPDGMQLAVACKDNSVAIFTIISPTGDYKKHPYLFSPKYKTLARYTDNAKIVQLCWSLVFSF
jgi:hypothetical protein